MRRGAKAGAVAALVWLLCPTGAWAQEAWGFRGNLDIFPYAGFLTTSDNSLDPDNALLRLPGLTLGAEVRPNLSVSYGSTFQLVLRPRFWGLVTATQVGSGPLAYGNELNSVINDLFGVYTASPKLSVS